jgi:hypothetical protein
MLPPLNRTKKLNVYIGQSPSKNNLRTIDKLIEVARTNL